MTDTLREAVERLAADLVHADVPAWLRDRVQDILADHPAPAPDADLCGLCKQPATGLASIDTTRYCHGDEDASPTCYEVACWRETGRVSIPMDLDARPGLCACGQPGCSDGSDTLAERTFTREAEAARCGCGNPDAHDYAPPSVPAGSDTLVAASSVKPMLDPYKSGGMVDTMTDPYRGSAGSDTADEPRVCGERYGVQPDICRKPEGHEGWHDDGTGQWPVEPAPSLTPEPVACVWDVATGYQCPRCQLYVAVVKRDSPVYCPRGCVQEPAPPEDEREALAAAIYAGGDEPEWITTADGSPNAGSYEHADRVIAAGWRSPTEVAALVTDAERRTREQVAEEAALAVEEACPHEPDSHAEGTCDVCDFAFAAAVDIRDIAARAATKAVSDA